MLKKLILITTLSYVNSAFALFPTITPMVTYQQNTKLEPEPHTDTKVSYGASARFGMDILGLEAMYLTGESNNKFSDGSTNSSERETIRAGLSSYLGLGIIGIRLGAGADATKANETRKNEFSEITYQTDNEHDINPYALGGLYISFMPMVSFTGGVTYVFTDMDNFISLGRQKREVYFGISVSL